MGKTEVYSWRVSAAVKAALEDQARRSGQPVAALLDHVVQQWLAACRRAAVTEADEQARLHAAAARAFGRISAGGPYDAKRVRRVIRGRLTRRRDG